MNANTSIELGHADELLKELHILTRDGKLNQDSRRKLKQVNHLIQFIEPLLEGARPGRSTLTIVDHGAGKSYLGFILYELLLRMNLTGRIYSIETRPDLIENARKLADRLQYIHMSFLNVSVEASMQSSHIPKDVDIVTALHACDTATDDAIRFGLSRSAKHIVLIPCCQAEVARVLNKNKNKSFSRTPLSEIWRHPMHTREFGSHLTNVLRCLLLEAHGYQVRVTELVGWEHSMKNELIIASKTELRRNNVADRTAQILQELNLEELRDRFIY